jgi:hypothetical protein
MCKAITKTGTVCKRKATSDSGFCTQHDKMHNEIVVTPEVTGECYNVHPEEYEAIDALLASDEVAPEVKTFVVECDDRICDVEAFDEVSAARECYLHSAVLLETREPQGEGGPSLLTFEQDGRKCYASVRELAPAAPQNVTMPKPVYETVMTARCSPVSERQAPAPVVHDSPRYDLSQTVRLIDDGFGGKCYTIEPEAPELAPARAATSMPITAVERPASQEPGGAAEVAPALAQAPQWALPIGGAYFSTPPLCGGHVGGIGRSPSLTTLAPPRPAPLLVPCEGAMEFAAMFA